MTINFIDLVFKEQLFGREKKNNRKRKLINY